jgi:histidinol phosphatase-like enzyme (inositol monophosphatase family)
MELAGLSGAFIRSFYGSADLKVDLKDDQSPVTAADKGAEELMRDHIARKFPSHGVVGEEYGADRGDAEFVWLLDPIDGTKSFTASVPLFGTLIALVHNGQPALGCIHQPILGQLLVGDNVSATLNGAPVRTRQTASIEEATLLSTDPSNLAKFPGGRGYQDLMGKARLARTWGDCYGYLLVATGKADVMYDPIMNPWDIAALVPIIKGAGGIITNPKGGPAYPADSIVASGSAALHAQVLKAMAS